MAFVRASIREPRVPARRLRLQMLGLSVLLASVTLLSACAQPDATPPAPSRAATPSRTPTETAAPETAAPETPIAVPSAPAPAAPGFDKKRYSIDDPSSIWVVSNKARALSPADFAPADLTLPVGIPNGNSQPLREPAARALERMDADAASAGIKLSVTSAYRSYSTQVSLYNNYVARDGKDAADTYSARPGHSEHQTGLAVDLDDSGGCSLEACFANTPAGIWLAANAPRYGFVLRYPDGKSSITGFTFEPWHFRYVGPELATEMQNTGVRTLEEFFGLPAAPDYI